VLSDHFLQGQTGAEITAEMKQLKPEVPVVILSGAVEEPDGIQHADLFLAKTGTPAELLEALARLLGPGGKPASNAAM
jgi:CheY-like chemotaxis protein